MATVMFGTFTEKTSSPFDDEKIEGDIRNELDFLVACVKHMRKLRQEKGFIYAHAFQLEMEKYFGLDAVDWTTFIYDDLIRLSEAKAGGKDGQD